MKYQKAIIDTQFIYTNLKTRWKLDIKRLKKKAKHDHTGLWSPALDRLKKQDYKFKVRQGYRGRSYLKKIEKGEKVGDIFLQSQHFTGRSRTPVSGLTGLHSKKQNLKFNRLLKSDSLHLL